MYENPKETNETSYWKPEIKYTYKATDGVKKISGQKVTIKAHFQAYDFTEKREAENIEELDFLCAKVLYKIDSQDFLSNFVENPFQDEFQIRNKKDNFKLIGSVKWDASARAFVGLPPGYTIRLTTSLIGLNKFTQEIEIDLSSTVATDLLRKKTRDGNTNPKAEFMFNNTAVLLSPAKEHTTLEGYGTIKLLEPSEGSLVVEEYKESLDELVQKIQKALKPLEPEEPKTEDLSEVLTDEEIPF